jgi:Tfp pilus assembly protein PilP
MAAMAPGLRAQVNPATTTSSVKSALGDKGQTAQQQPAKPPAKPAAQAPAKPTPGTAAKPAPKTPKPAAQGPGKPAPAAATKPAPQAAKPGGTPSAKPAAKGTRKKGARKPKAKGVEKPATPGAPKAAAQSELKAARRDPFESLINRNQGKGGPALPPGKAGLQVSTLRLDGIVKAPNGMIAVVSNPQSRTYFLREGDHLYDGSVEKITMDGVSFHEEGKDAFGKPVERQVNKRIYSTSSGEQQ